MFSESLKELRNRKQLSIKELSELTKVPTRLIRDYEAGKSLPSDNILERFCDYFKVDKSNLLPEEEAKLFYSSRIVRNENKISRKKNISGILIYSFSILLCFGMISFVFIPYGEQCHCVFNEVGKCYYQTFEMSWLYCLKNKQYDYEFMVFVLCIVGFLITINVLSVIFKRTKVLFWILSALLTALCLILFFFASLIPMLYKAC